MQSGVHRAAPQCESLVAHLRPQIPIRKLSPVLRPAHVGVRQHDSQRKRTFVICDPDLKIHCLGASPRRDVPAHPARPPLDVGDRSQTALELGREARGEQRRERQPHLQVAHKVDNGIVDRARLICLSVDPGSPSQIVIFEPSNVTDRRRRPRLFLDAQWSGRLSVTFRVSRNSIFCPLSCTTS